MNALLITFLLMFPNMNYIKHDFKKHKKCHNHYKGDTHTKHDKDDCMCAQPPEFFDDGQPPEIDESNLSIEDSLDDIIDEVKDTLPDEITTEIIKDVLEGFGESNGYKIVNIQNSGTCEISSQTSTFGFLVIGVLLLIAVIFIVTGNPYK